MKSDQVCPVSLIRNSSFSLKKSAKVVGSQTLDVIAIIHLVSINIFVLGLVVATLFGLAWLVGSYPRIAIPFGVIALILGAVLIRRDMNKTALQNEVIREQQLRFNRVAWRDLEDALLCFDRKERHPMLERLNGVGKIRFQELGETDLLCQSEASFVKNYVIESMSSYKRFLEEEYLKLSDKGGLVVK